LLIDKGVGSFSPNKYEQTPHEKNALYTTTREGP
jgi:hypothetical protein